MVCMYIILIRTHTHQFVSHMHTVQVHALLCCMDNLESSRYASCLREVPSVQKGSQEPSGHRPVASEQGGYKVDAGSPLSLPLVLSSKASGS